MYLDEADNLILEDGDERINKTAFFLNLKDSKELGLKKERGMIRGDGYIFTHYYARLSKGNFRVYENWMSKETLLKRNKWKASDKKRTHERFKKFLRRVKKKMSCKICGYNKSNYAKHFHHLDKTNKREVSSMNQHSLKEVKKEIRKCVLVCANCHAEIHEKERNNYE